MPSVALGKSSFGFICQFSSYILWGDFLPKSKQVLFFLKSKYKTSIRSMQKLAKIQSLNSNFPHLNFREAPKNAEI